MIETTTEKATGPKLPKAEPVKPKSDATPIAWIRLRTPCDLPGHTASDVITTDRRTTVEQVPGRRAFRVTFTEHDKEPKVRYVPESNVLVYEDAP